MAVDGAAAAAKPTAGLSRGPPTPVPEPPTSNLHLCRYKTPSLLDFAPTYESKMASGFGLNGGKCFMLCGEQLFFVRRSIGCALQL